MFLRFQRSIACAVFSRLSVGICIDTEHGEVTGMTGLHPVVCLPPNLPTEEGGAATIRTSGYIFL